MPVPVMDVVNVGVTMNQPLVTMLVGMRHLCELGGRVFVLMVVVVGVLVRMLQSLVLVQVLVPVTPEQESACGHGCERE